MALPDHPLLEHGTDKTVAVVGDHGLRVGFQGLFNVRPHVSGDGLQPIGNLRVHPPPLFKNLRVVFQVLDGDPARRVEVSQKIAFGDDLFHLLDGGFQVPAIGDAQGFGTGGVGHRFHGLHQRLFAESGAGQDGNHRHAEQAGEFFMVDLDAPPPGHIDHVQGHAGGDSQFEELDGQVKIPLQAGRIDDVDGHPGAFVDQKIPGHHLFDAVGGQ